MLEFFLNTRIGRALASAGALLLLALSVFGAGRYAGGSAARQKAKDDDHANANQIRDRVDAAKLADAADPRDAAAKLREAGQLRD